MLERICWGVLALIHALPTIALVRPALITRLYGVAPEGDVFVLLHHRAALFAVVFLICGWAVADSDVRRLATLAAAVSMIGFLAIYAAAGAPATLRQIAVADLIGLPALAYAGWKAFAVSA